MVTIYEDDFFMTSRSMVISMKQYSIPWKTISILWKTYKVLVYISKDIILCHCWSLF